MLATLTRALALGALLLAPAFASAAPADAQAPPPGYDFESGWDGCSAPGWLGANAGAPTQTDAQAAQGTHSLALPVRFTGGGYEQAGADKRLHDAPGRPSPAGAVPHDLHPAAPGP